MTARTAPRDAAVVLGLDCITGLQTARILAGRGVPVVGLASDVRHFAARTRVCERVLQSALDDESLVDTLVRLRPQLLGRPVLFPCTDLSVLLVSRHRDRLAGYRILLPEHDVVELLMDKMRFLEYAIAEGLPVPRTVILRNRDDATEAAASMRYPCVVKPPVKSPTWLQHTKEKAYLVRDPVELLQVYDRVSSWAPVLVTQEWVEGGEDELYSCNAYFDRDARPLVTFVARKLRQWPPGTGTSCLGEACRNDEVLVTTADLFARVGFHGLAYLEMKRDPRTGRHYIIEPNVGRPTGRSAIAEAGRVELLYAAYCDALGMPVPGTRQTDEPVKWLDLRRDLQSAAYYVRRGDLTLGQWWRSVRGRKVHAVLSVRDPLPALAELGYAAGRALRRRNRESHAGAPPGQRAPSLGTV